MRRGFDPPDQFLILLTWNLDFRTPSPGMHLAARSLKALGMEGTLFHTRAVLSCMRIGIILRNEHERKT